MLQYWTYRSLTASPTYRPRALKQHADADAKGTKYTPLKIFLKRRRVIFSVLDEAHEDESCEHAGACDQLETEVQRSIKR